MRQEKRKQEGDICGSERQGEGDQPAALPSCSSLDITKMKVCDVMVKHICTS